MRIFQVLRKESMVGLMKPTLLEFWSEFVDDSFNTQDVVSAGGEISSPLLYGC